MIDFKKMCDNCLRMLGDDEDMYVFKAVDDCENTRLFKGHKECIEQIGETLKQLYGKKG